MPTTLERQPQNFSDHTQSPVNGNGIDQVIKGEELQINRKTLQQKIISLSLTIHANDHTALRTPDSSTDKAWTDYVSGLLELYTDLEESTDLEETISSFPETSSLNDIKDLLGVHSEILGIQYREILKGLRNYDFPSGDTSDDESRESEIYQTAVSLIESVQTRGVKVRKTDKKTDIREFNDFSGKFVSFLALHLFVCGYRRKELREAVITLWPEASDELLSVWEWPTIEEFATKNRTAYTRLKQWMEDNNLIDNLIYKMDYNVWSFIIPPDLQQYTKKNYRTSSGRGIDGQQGDIQSLADIEQWQQQIEQLKTEYPFLEVTLFGTELRTEIYRVFLDFDNGLIDAEKAMQKTKDILTNCSKKGGGILLPEDAEDLLFQADFLDAEELDRIFSYFGLCRKLGIVL